MSRDSGGPFSSKRLDDAYAQGREDAQTGEGRLSARRMAALTLGSPDFFLPGGQARFDARMRSYVQGYEDALRVFRVEPARHGAAPPVDPSSPPSSPPSSGASVAASYDQQLELLSEMDSFLRTLQERLGQALQGYERRLSSLHEAGLLDDYHAHLERQALEHSRAQIRQLVEALGERDLVAVRRIIAAVQAHRDQMRT